MAIQCKCSFSEMEGKQESKFNTTPPLPTPPPKKYLSNVNVMDRKHGR